MVTFCFCNGDCPWVADRTNGLGRHGLQSPPLHLAGWLSRKGYTPVSADHGLRINNSAAVLQAAVERQGLALARSVMVQDDLNAGRLIRPLLEREVEWPLQQAYYIVYRPERGDLSNVRVFRDWLMAEAGVFVSVS
ncbi:LysR substrate-binding domain-containing protein [Pseudomonas sp. Marseille-QA0332]